MIKIHKRDGSLQDFDSKKIFCAIANACTGENEQVNVETLVNNVISALPPEQIVGIETIQDTVERALMAAGHYNVAKKYILYREKRHVQRNDASVLDKIPLIKVPWGPLGYVTYKRTYARYVNDNKTEEYNESIKRVLTACQTQLNVGFTNIELQKAYSYLMNLKFSVAGRFLWQLGTSTVNRLGLASLQNCAFVIIDHPIDSFIWVFDMLMLGVGVGFNVQRHHINKLPCVIDKEIYAKRQDTKDADFIVPDSREGWVSLLEKVLTSFFYTGKSFSYSTILVRGAGTPINGFGGVASGPEDLVIGIDRIQKILSNKRGKQLSSIDCLDIVNIIASIVVAGSIRRSACICLGDYDDIDYLRAKRWDLGNIPNWRAFSNNSVVCDDVTKLPEEFWDGYNGNGEPYGLVNLKLAKKIGRTKDGDKYPDPDVEGVNPCGEIFLDNYQTCCLSELYLPNLTSFDEAKEVASIAYRICKHSLLLPCHQPNTEASVHKKLRIGLGITGYMQATREQQQWLSPLYEYLREYDESYSKMIGVRESIKLTTIKPSGTLSLLAGVTPGAHPGIYPYFIRRIRIASSNRLVDLCKSHGYHCEYQKNFDGTDDVKTIVVSFPCAFPSHTRFARDMSAVDQLEVIKLLQHDWSDNAVSVTIYYRKKELSDMRRWLEQNYSSNLKSVSFLLHSDHGFVQAPYQEITKEEYEEMARRSLPIVEGSIDIEEDYGGECSLGACPIK